MRGTMADNDIQGQMKALVFLLRSEEWRDIWSSLNLTVRTFGELSLDVSVPDAELWHMCQREQIVLVTGNRNKTGPDSLETTIEAHGTPNSLPVLTVASPKQVLFSRDYADRVVESLLQYLLAIDNFRGTGRLWLP
jgi:hypothetical protein